MIIFVCSESGQFLVSLGGPVCRVWDVNASAAVASLSKEKVSWNWLLVSFQLYIHTSNIIVLDLMSLNIE
jgi:hypothetical protein